MEKTRQQPCLEVRLLEGEAIHFQVKSGQIRAGHIFICDLYVGRRVGTGTVWVQELRPDQQFRGLLGRDPKLQKALRRALTMEEKRNRPRLSCDLPVSSPSLSGEARTVDISESGIRVRAAEEVAVGAILPLSLTLQCRRKWRLHSQIRWCRAGEGEFDFGGRFVNMDWKPVVYDIHTLISNPN